MNVWGNLRTKLLIVFLCLLLAPIIGMGIYSYLFMSQTVLDKAIEVEQQKLDSQADHVRFILLETQNTLIYVSNLQAMRVLENSTEDTEPYQSSLQILFHDLQNHVQMYPNVQNLAYYNALGKPLVEVQSGPFSLQTSGFTNFVKQVVTAPMGSTHLFLNERIDSRLPDLTLALRTHNGAVIITIWSEALFQPGIYNGISETWSLLLPIQATLHAVGEQQTFLSPQSNEIDVWRRISEGYYQHEEKYTFFENMSIPTSLGQYNVVLFHTIPSQRLQPNLNLYAQAFVSQTIGVLLCVIALGLFAIDRFITPLRHLKEKVDEIRRTEKTPTLPKKLPPDEIGELSLAFYTMAIELESKRKSERELVEKLISAQEDERKRIAYDLHDGLIQQLVGARFYINQAKSLVSSEAADTLSFGYDTLSSAIVEGRRIMQGLHPSILDDLGIAEALIELSQTIAKVANWELILDIHTLPREPSRLTSVTLYRIAQEAFNNAIKHASAQQVTVKLWADELIYLMITDDGEGFDQMNHRLGWGLRTMHERVSLLDGMFDIESHVGVGTTLRVIIPYQAIETERTI